MVKICCLIITDATKIELSMFRKASINRLFSSNIPVQEKFHFDLVSKIKHCSGLSLFWLNITGDILP